MVKDGNIWVGNDEGGNGLFILPKMANRHGLVAGATGTGKTVTVKVLAEAFSEIGVPVFLADVKGDLAGMVRPGTDTEDMRERIDRFGIGDAFSYQAYPGTFWDIFGKKGIPLRTSISEFGPLLLSRVLGLNDLQSDIMSIVFKIADDNDWLLADTKDLKAVLKYVQENNAALTGEYGRIQPASIGAIVRALVALELEGGDRFFGEPALMISDWLAVDASGKGTITILDSQSLINNTRLYSTFLLWFLSELFETLPEVGDLAKPKLVFFFDEAHLLFHDTGKDLLDKIEQVVKLIRSKGVGIYFCTQNPRDIPDGILSQLGNKIQHALRAYTPAEQKKLKAVAEAFRANPDFDTLETISALGTGEAVVSFLTEKGIPDIARKAYILPPQSRMGPLSEEERETEIKGSLLYSRYAGTVDPDSAYEILGRLDKEKEEAALEADRLKTEEKEREREEKLRLKEEAAARKQEERERKQEEAKAAREEAARLKKEEAQKAREEKKKAAQARMVGKSVTGTVGREVGKAVGGKFGSLGKKVGGNLGAQLGRGILDTLFKG